MSLDSTWQDLAEIHGRQVLAKVALHVTLSNPDYERWRLAARHLFTLVDPERPFWQSLAGESGRFSFLIHNSPLDPNQAAADKWLPQKLMEATYQQRLTDEVSNALDLFWTARSILRSCKSSPFLDWLTDTHLSYDGQQHCALIVAKKDWVRPSRATLRKNVSLRDIEVFDLSCLSQTIALERVYVCGAITLFPTSLYTCARAEEIEWGLFDWMKSELPAREQGIAEALRTNVDPLVIRRPIEDSLTDASPDEVDPTGIWDAAETPIPSSPSTDLFGSLDTVNAVELLLVDGSRTFAPVAENVPMATAVDSWTPGSIWLGRKLGKDLTPDDFVIVRTYGESDVILDLANKILGPKADELRLLQAEWKTALRAVRENTSMDQLIQALQGAGSLIADHQNVRNWMSPRHIRTQNKEDFTAILRVCGLETRSENIWQMMGIVNRAHIRAGMQLKASLTAALRKHSGSELLAAGRLEVVYTGLDAGSLTAVRIEHIGGQKEVMDSSLLRLIEPWQG